MYFIDIVLRYIDDANLEQVIGFFEEVIEKHIPRPNMRKSNVYDKPNLILFKKIKLSKDTLEVSEIKRKIRILFNKNNIDLEFEIHGYPPTYWDRVANRVLWLMGFSSIIGLGVGIYSAFFS